MSQKLDAIDIKILDLLQDDGRVTIKKISEVLNLSTTPIFERIKKLEKGGYIKNYATLLNHRKLDLKQVVFIELTLKEHSRSYIEKFANEMKLFPEVLECYRVTGSFDFLIKILVKDIESYETFILTKLSLLSNLGNVQSHIALSEAKNTTKINLKSINLGE
jgi:DNA-binding Lrp family transcriptional regulator